MNIQEDIDNIKEIMAALRVGQGVAIERGIEGEECLKRILEALPPTTNPASIEFVDLRCNLIVGYLNDLAADVARVKMDCKQNYNAIQDLKEGKANASK